MIVVSHYFNPFWKRSSASSVWDWGHSAFAFGLDWNQLMPTYYVPHTNSSSEPNEFLDTPSDDIGPTRSVNLKSIVTVHANQRSYYMFLLGCNSHTHALLLSNVIHFFSQKKHLNLFHILTPRAVYCSVSQYLVTTNTTRQQKYNHHQS